MNRNAAATKVMGASKRNTGNTCWSSEWSFIEDVDVDVALQITARSFTAGKQAVTSHDDSSSSSSQSGSNFLGVGT